MKKIISKNEIFIKYVLSAGLCFAIDIFLFTVFNYLFKSKISFSIFLATVLARIISSCINYILNKNKVFGFKNDKKIDFKTLFQYGLLVIIQMFVSSTLVTNIYNRTLFNESLIKIPVDCLIFIVNFFVQKKIIFNKEDKVLKNKSDLILLIYGIITSISFIVNPLLTVEKLKIDIKGHVLILTILSIFFGYFYMKYYNSTKKHTPLSVISFIFALLLIFGYSFDQVDSGILVYGNIQVIILSLVKFVGYYTFINLTLSLGYEFIDNVKINGLKHNKFFDTFRANPFKTSFILMAILYGIYLIAYYPGVVGYDPSYQIKEVMGIENFYSESINIINSHTLITQFNPILHTLLIGGLFKIGYLLGNVNFGIFLYTFIQVIAMILTLSYSIEFMFKEKVPDTLIFIVLLIYLLVPIFPFYAISAFKDTYFAIFFILFVIQLYKCVKYDLKGMNMIFLILSALGLCFFRLNGFMTVIISLVLVLLSIKKNRKMIVISGLIVGLIYFSYNGIINYLKITPTSFREVLSVPIQQTSALIVNKEDVISEKDRVIIEKIIDYDSVKEKYDPELADPVKNTYNKNATQEEIKDYFEVWLKYLFKEPLIYVEATVNNVYGYFYPEAQQWYFYYKKYNTLNEAGFDYHYNSLKVVRSLLYDYGMAFQYIPILSLFVNIGITSWIYMFLIAYLIIKKEKKYINILIPSILTILMCVVGPVNTYYRYVIPYSMSLPVIICLLYISTRKEIVNKD